MIFTRLRVLLLAVLAVLPARVFAAPSLLDFNFGIPTSDVAQDLGLFQKVGLNPKFFLFQSGAPLLAGPKSESVVSTGLGVAFALGQNIPLKSGSGHPTTRKMKGSSPIPRARSRVSTISRPSGKSAQRQGRVRKLRCI